MTRLKWLCFQGSNQQMGYKCQLVPRFLFKANKIVLQK